MSENKSICKNIAFSDSGKCLMGKECICETNKKLLEETDSPAPIPDTRGGEDAFLKWLDREVAYNDHMATLCPPNAGAVFSGRSGILQIAKTKYLSGSQPKEPASTDHNPQEGEKIISPSNTEVLEMHLRGRKLPDDLKFPILSAMNEFASISVIEWAKGEEEESGEKALPEEVKHVHVALPSGGVATVDPNASPELLNALDQMVQLAKESLPVEEEPIAMVNKIVRVLNEKLEAFGDKDSGIRIFGRIEAAHDIDFLFTQQLSTLRAQAEQAQKNISAMTEELSAYRELVEWMERAVQFNNVNMPVTQKMLKDILKRYPTKQ
jgi:hypothetical protein